MVAERVHTFLREDYLRALRALMIPVPAYSLLPVHLLFSVPGTYAYTVTTTGVCNNVSLSGTITVGAEPTITALPVRIRKPDSLYG